ncbi:MAG TPA: AzlD domain-containing protein [Acidimicrobiales bacterium]
MIAAAVALAVLTILIKGAGSLLPEVPDALARRLGGVAPALLASLAYVELVDDGGAPVLDEKAAGVAVAVVLAWRRAPFGVCVVAGAVVAAGLRAL